MAENKIDHLQVNLADTKIVMLTYTKLPNIWMTFLIIHNNISVFIPAQVHFYFLVIKFILHHHTTTTNLLSSYKTCRILFTLLECLYPCIIPLAYWIRNHYSTLNKTLPSHKYIYMAMASSYMGCIKPLQLVSAVF